MKFADLLREYIGERTLESIVAGCKERGVEIDRLLLGRLRSGDRLPPENDQVTKTIAEVCGRDPRALILLAKYHRSPHEVMQEIIGALVMADHLAIHLQDQERIPTAMLIARLKAGENVPPAEIIQALTTDEPHVERMREAHEHYRDRAFEIIDLITDPEKVAWGRAGEKGTFEAAFNLPEGTLVGMRDFEDPTQRGLGRLRELVVRLSEAAKVPEGSLIAAIAAARAGKDPDFDVVEFLRTTYGGE